MKSRANNKMQSFQFLRGISALIVIFSHIKATSFINGTMGVAFFMLMGGFFAMLSSEKKEKKILKNKILNIIILYYGVTFLVFIISKLFPNLFNNTEPSILNLIKSLLFIPYYVTGCGHRPLLDVGWYLNVDIFFTLIFSICNKYFFKNRGKICCIFFFIMICIKYILNINIFIFDVYFNFYMLYYIIGILMYYLYNYLEKKNYCIKKQNYFLEVVVFIIIFVFSYFFKLNVISCIIVSIIFLILMLYSKVSMKNPFCKFGDISFSIYLIHEFIVKGFDRTIYQLSELNLISIIMIVACICLTYYVSKLVEKYRIKLTLFLKEKYKL